jgi:branched-chain amino acid transport system substrate-binding protein
MQYLKDYKAKYNEPLSSFGGHAWDALYLVVGALEQFGCDKSKIRYYIENTKNFVGQHGVFNYSKEDHNGLTREAFQMVVVKNGEWALAE